MNQCTDASHVLRVGRYAAIDIGTVTCRMLVADVDEAGCLHEVDREYKITNLGEGVDASGVLKPEAMERVVAAVSEYRAILDTLTTPEHPHIHVTAMATSAARDAQNAAVFTEKLAAVGITLSVIPGQQEAALSFKGASCDFPGEQLIVVDIGGGSTEVVAGPAGGRPVQSFSFNIGCRRVTEKFFVADPPCADELDAARAWIAEGMAAFFDELHATGFRADRLIAVAGTATTVVSIHERMAVYDTARVHKARVSRLVLNDVYQQLSGVALADRERIVGLDPGRAPVIVAGMIILQRVLDFAGMDAFTVSESDILHGIILDAAAH